MLGTWWLLTVDKKRGLRDLCPTWSKQSVGICRGWCPTHCRSLLLLLLCVPLQTVQYDLLPNGDSIPVTASNRLLYVYLLADWHLNAKLGRAAAAFAGEGKLGRVC